MYPTERFRTSPVRGRIVRAGLATGRDLVPAVRNCSANDAIVGPGLQLERSLECLSGGEPDVIFDRCPVDMLGYLLVLAEGFPLEKWLPRVQAAIGTLDLIVFLPVEARDRIALPASADAAFRLDVDQMLKEIFLDGSLDLEMEVLEVTGPIRERVKQVLSRLFR